MLLAQNAVIWPEIGEDAAHGRLGVAVGGRHGVVVRSLALDREPRAEAREGDGAGGVGGGAGRLDQRPFARQAASERTRASSKSWRRCASGMA